MDWNGRTPLWTLPEVMLLPLAWSTMLNHPSLHTADSQPAMLEGLLTRFFETMGQAIFISHQWLSANHPDPLGLQFHILKDALRTEVWKGGGVVVSFGPGGKALEWLLFYKVSRFFFWQLALIILQFIIITAVLSLVLDTCFTLVIMIICCKHIYIYLYDILYIYI